jgi:hypothetical protein
MNSAQSDEVQAMKGTKLKQPASWTKSTTITASHNRKKAISTKLDLQCWAINHIKRNLLHRKVQPEKSDYHRLTQHEVSDKKDP